MKSIIWSKPQCPQCDQAKALMKLKNVEYEERLLGDNWSKEQLLEAVPNAKSVPQIFINDNLIGGLAELKKFLT